MKTFLLETLFGKIAKDVLFVKDGNMFSSGEKLVKIAFSNICKIGMHSHNHKAHVHWHKRIFYIGCARRNLSVMCPDWPRVTYAAGNLHEARVSCLR